MSSTVALAESRAKAPRSSFGWGSVALGASSLVLWFALQSIDALLVAMIPWYVGDDATITTGSLVSTGSLYIASVVTVIVTAVGGLALMGASLLYDTERKFSLVGGGLALLALVLAAGGLVDVLA